MQKQILYVVIFIFSILTSCVSSKKKAHETVTNVYTSEHILQKEIPKDTVAPTPTIQKEVALPLNDEAIDGGGAVPKQARKEISPEEKEKIKVMMRERMKAKQKKTN